jgi:hypothetical protein
MSKLKALRAVFGNRIPANARDALNMLESSPMAPPTRAGRNALRSEVLSRLGAPLKGDTFDSAPAQALRRPAPVSSADGLRQVISLDQAQQAFDALAAAKDIPHHFIDEGCHYRAHVACWRLEEQGIYSEKVFLVPRKGDLRIDSDKHPLGFTLAMFHNAAAIVVRTADGSLERRVLDPSLFAGPVPLDTWASRLRSVAGAGEDFVFLPRFASHLTQRDDPPDGWDPADLEEALGWGGIYQEVQKMYEETGFYEHLLELVGEGR